MLSVMSTITKQESADTQPPHQLNQEMMEKVDEWRNTEYNHFHHDSLLEITDHQPNWEFETMMNEKKETDFNENVRKEGKKKFGTFFLKY